MNWIEINEDRSNLPELYKNVLITTNTNGVYTAYRHHENTWFALDDQNRIYTNEIIAWMPKPEPFKK